MNSNARQRHGCVMVAYRVGAWRDDDTDVAYTCIGQCADGIIEKRPADRYHGLEARVCGRMLGFRERLRTRCAHAGPEAAGEDDCFRGWHQFAKLRGSDVADQTMQ